MSYIYILSHIDGSYYIGHTKHNENDRLKQHIYDSRKDWKKHRLIYQKMRETNIEDWQLRKLFNGNRETESIAISLCINDYNCLNMMC